MRAFAITVYYVVFLRSRSRYVSPRKAGEVVSSLPAADVASFPTLQPLYTGLSFLSFHSVTLS